MKLNSIENKYSRTKKKKKKKENKPRVKAIRRTAKSFIVQSCLTIILKIENYYNF